MSGRIDIEERLASLGSSDTRKRDLAAAELADFIEASCLTYRQLKRAVRILMHAAGVETDEFARESIFNALSEASMAKGGDKLDWDPIFQLIDQLPDDCLEHALVILGFSGLTKYEEKVRQYVRHPDEAIRRTALESLAQIDAKKKQGSKQRSA